jgi:hypothetical protein
MASSRSSERFAQRTEVCWSFHPEAPQEVSMAEFMKNMKVKAVIAVIALCILTILYSYFISDTVMTKITDAQMTKVDGRFMVATEERPYVNFDAKYRFKFNSGNVQNDAIRLKGKVVKIKKYGWRIPVLSWYENIVKIEEVK